MGCKIQDRDFLLGHNWMFCGRLLWVSRTVYNLQLPCRPHRAASFTALKSCFTHFNYTTVITTMQPNEKDAQFFIFQALTLLFHTSSPSPKGTQGTLCFHKTKTPFLWHCCWSMFIHYLLEWIIYMGKVVRRWMDILYGGRARCFSSKTELFTGIFFHKLHLIITSNPYSSRFHSLFPSRT